MRIRAFTSGRMYLRGRHRESFLRVIPCCGFTLPFPTAMASGAAFVLGRTFRSISIRYCRAAARARRCNRSFLALLESRRLNLAAYAALGSVRGCFARRRCECVLIKIGRELYDRLDRILLGWSGTVVGGICNFLITISNYRRGY